MAALTAVVGSFSNAFNVSIAAGNCLCFKNITALHISKSPASPAYSEFFISRTHQSYPIKFTYVTVIDWILALANQMAGYFAQSKYYFTTVIANVD